jgi:ketosteroid isomerase-like protein
MVVKTNCGGDTERAMSEENVEALRRAATAANNKDPSVLVELLDPEVVWEPTNRQALDLVGTYRGLQEVQGFFARWEQAWEDWEWSHPEMRANGDKVFTRMHLWGRGRGSGLEVEGDVWQVWSFRDGKVIHYTDYETREQALEAAGLSA